MTYLNDREQTIVTMYAQGYTYGEIGKVLGISGNRVSQILMKTLRHLRRVARWNNVSF